MRRLVTHYLIKRVMPLEAPTNSVYNDLIFSSDSPVNCMICSIGRPA